MPGHAVHWRTKLKKKKTTKTSRSLWKVKLCVWSFVFAVDRSAAASAKRQSALCWIPTWCPACGRRKGTARMTVPVNFARDINSWYSSSLLCSKWLYNSGSHQLFWPARPGLLQGPLGLPLPREHGPTQDLLGFPATSWPHSRMRPTTDGHKRKAYSDQDTSMRVFLLALIQAMSISSVLIKAPCGIGFCFNSRPRRKAAEQCLCEQRCQCLSLPSPGALWPGVKHQTDPTPSARYHPHRDYASVQAERISVSLSLRHGVDVSKDWLFFFVCV